jgi:hypothetical protein
MPSFVILDESYTDYVTTGVRARAELAGLLAYCARLNAHVIPAASSTTPRARRMIGLGVSLGIGPHLGSPAVLDASLAEPGDEVVSPAPGSANKVSGSSPRPAWRSTPRLSSPNSRRQDKPGRRPGLSPGRSARPRA